MMADPSLYGFPRASDHDTRLSAGAPAAMPIEELLPTLGTRERVALGSLLAAGRIGGAEMVAANRWYEAYAVAEHGAFDPDKAGATGGTRLYAQERQLAAATAYRMARTALGAAGTERLRWFLSEGLSFTALARQLGQDRRMLTGMVIADLARLAEHYAAVDRARRGELG